MENTKTAALAAIYTAIRERRAWLKTAFGNILVTGYNDATGWVTANNGNDCFSQRSFLVCRDAILIAERPIREEKRVVRHYSFPFEGRMIQATSHEIETTWNWPS